MATTLFEHTVEFDESKYRDIWANKPTRWLRFGMTAIVGVIMLYWSYTLLLGVLLLAICLILLVSPRLLKRGVSHSFQGQTYLNKPTTFGVSEEGLWVRGESLDASAGWPLLVTWQIRGDWLILSATGIPQVLLPVSAMKSAGHFERIMKLASTYGTEFK